ncbi:MAG: AMP-binding protein [Mogibacterium sp.]|nr:AMP-binding protein [Mogibacterium sp.]
MDGIISGNSFSRYWYTDIREIVTLKDMLAGSRELYAKNPAFWVKEKKGQPYQAVNYELLQHDVNALGTKLCEMGLRGERIAVMGQGCYEWIVTYLAVMNGIGVIVPIDKELSRAEIGNLMRAGDCHTIFCTRQECQKLRGLPMIDRLVVMEFYGDRVDLQDPVNAGEFNSEKYRGILLDGAEEDRAIEICGWRSLLADGETLLQDGRTEYLDAEIDPDAMSVILFTSGTTGNPKGVMLSHRNITSNIMDVCKVCQVYQSDKTLSILPIHHTYECTLGMLLVLYRGASTAFCEGIKYISQNMKEAQNTFIIVVPRVLEMVYDRIQKGVAKSGKEKAFNRAMRVNKTLRKAGINISRMLFQSVLAELGGKLRCVITGAAALNPNIFRAFEDFGVMVLQGYGMTECTPLISGTPGSAPQERYRKAGSVGATVDTGEIKIIDKDESGIGEILFRGPNVMLGYYNMPEETAKVIEPDGFMHTGDLGFVDNEGWLYLTGRKKNVIVTTTGENVYPEEIEDDIISDPCIEECMVFAYKNEGEEYVGIQILPMMENVREKIGHDPTEEELDAFFKDLVREFNQKLSVYKRIRAVFVRRQDFVRTTTRKVKRQDNPLTEETIIGYHAPELEL